MLLKPPEDHVDMTEDEPLWVCKSMHMHIGMHIIMSIIIAVWANFIAVRLLSSVLATF